MPSHIRSITLCYHAVSPTWEDGLAVTPEAFEHQVRSLLARGLTPVSAEQALLGRPATFHVTFDDCYQNIRPALGLLRALDVPATVFACSSLADGGLPFSIPEVVGRADGCEHELDTMTWDELREWAGHGVEIGSHTVTHPHLPQLAHSDLVAELEESRRRSEDVLGLPCRYIAYPYGESNTQVRAAAKRAGYTAAFGLDEDRRSPDLFAFPRVDIYRGTSAIRFRTKTSRIDGPIRAVGAAMRAVHLRR